MQRSLVPDARLDRLLRLSPEMEALYEAATRDDRVVKLRRTVVIGLLLYNAYNLTSIVLIPDIVWLSVALRLLLVTPVSLVLAWLIGHVEGPTREKILAFGMVNAMAVQVFLFWFSHDPHSNYMIGELAMTLVFGSMMLPLRFHLGLVFTLLCLAMATLAIASKPELDPDLAVAFVIQFATACVFTIYANWRIEWLRCVSFLQTIDAGRQVAGAERRSQEFETLSMVDALTGLTNRRALDATLGLWCAEARGVSVMMIDVDFFKPYNDRFGHPEGDLCLRAIAEHLRAFAGKSGCMAARFGGEEFTLLVRDRNELETVRIANDIVEGVRALGLAHPTRPDGLGVVTVSIGISAFRHSAPTMPAQLLAEADMALYRAKQRGRNQWAGTETFPEAISA